MPDAAVGYEPAGFGEFTGISASLHATIPVFLTVYAFQWPSVSYKPLAEFDVTHFRLAKI